MKTCQKCGAKFPNWMKIDGVRRSLKSRKYCFECSPRGKHNTVPLHKGPKLEGSHILCDICGRVFEYRYCAGATRTRCGACRLRERSRRIKKLLIEYMGGVCEICGYNRCVGALEFHHKDPKQKDIKIGRSSRGFNELKREVDKCSLLCSNCHREVHAGIANTKTDK